MNKDLPYALKQLENELKESAQSFDDAQIDLVMLSAKTKNLMDDLVNNPNVLGLDDKIHFENCLKYLHILEEKLNDQMNQFVMNISYIR
jgi:flagellar biosynthesis chaperone FliJ